MLSKIPMGRFVQVDEIAALVAWLASEECSFSTGARVRHLRRPGDLLGSEPRAAPTDLRGALRQDGAFVAQSPAATRRAGAIHDAADHRHIGQRQVLARRSRSSMPPVGQNAMPGKTGAKARNSRRRRAPRPETI